MKSSVPRFQQERCSAWYQRKYRRLFVRWEHQKFTLTDLLTLLLSTSGFTKYY